MRKRKEKEIEKSEGKERAECGRWYIRVYGELDHKPMVELESLEIVVKELHKLEEENEKLKEKLSEITMVADDEKQSIEHILELEEEIRSLELEKRNREVESEELKMWLREKLPLALLKEYMEKFEGVDLKNV